MGKDSKEEERDVAKAGGGDGGGAGAANKRTPKPKVAFLPNSAPRPVYLAKPKSVQLLVETDAGSGLDLRGEAGTVGRFNVANDEDASFRLDLKGDVFHGRLLPCASTVCIMTLGPADAKIECVVKDFLQASKTGNVVGALAGRVVEGNVSRGRKSGGDYGDDDVGGGGGDGDDDRDDNDSSSSGSDGGDLHEVKPRRKSKPKTKPRGGASSKAKPRSVKRKSSDGGSSKKKAPRVA